MTSTTVKMTVRKTSTLPIPPDPKWLAIGHIPAAAVTVLAGDEGIGKSLWWVLLVAYITTGRALPEIGLPGRSARDIILVITEDSWSEVRARLMLAGADLDRVHLVSEEEDGSGSPTFPADMPLVMAAAAGLDLALIVVDAWLDTVSGGLQVRDTQQARSALHPWKETANRTGASILLLVNTNRMSEGTTRDKVGGTAALRQKARMLLFAAAKPGEEGLRLLIGPDKTNTTKLQHAVEYDVLVRQVRPARPDDPGTAAMLGNPMPTDKRITAHLSEWHDEQKQAQRPATADEKAETWLRGFMQQHQGKVLADSTKAAAKAAGHSPDRVTTLIKVIGGKSAPMERGGKWYFQLGQVSEVSELSQVSGDMDQGSDTYPEPEIQVSEPVLHIAETSESSDTSDTRVQATDCPSCHQTTGMGLVPTSEGPACRRCAPGIKANTRCIDCCHPRDVNRSGRCNPCHGRHIKRGAA